jgi:hypothetical protein
MQDSTKHDPWLATFFPQKKTKKEIKHGGIGIKLTYEAKHFHKLTRACIPCKYIGLNPPKIVANVH